MDKATNGDMLRAMTNEQLADFLADDRLNIFESICKKFDINVDLIITHHAMYCVLLEWLNREADNDEQGNGGKNS